MRAMEIALGADHAGYELKNLIRGALKGWGHEAVDFGVNGPKPADYPDTARKVAEAVARGQARRGIVVCGSGVGASVAANKVPGVRAALCHDTFSAHQGVEDDDANVLCLGSRVIGSALALEIVKVLARPRRFSKAERHLAPEE